MIGLRVWAMAAAAVLLAVLQAGAQGVAVKPADVRPFLGTWVFSMTNPHGSEQTVRIWDKDGDVAASVQIEKFPANDVTGIMKDGDVLVLTTTLRENGAPIWAVLVLTLDGQTMSVAKMLQRSETIKRGTAPKPPA